MLKAVLFDLDDTLYDHLHSARHGLLCLSQRYPKMTEVSVQELEDRYSAALESIHLRLLSGEVTQQEARTVRMQQLFASFGIEVNEETAFNEYTLFRRDYDSVCQVVAGSHELLQQLQARGLRMAIVTNNLVAEQIPKLDQLQLAKYFDVVSISEEVGVAKPDPQIFHVTLKRLSLSARDVVMVGDSLTSDIAGARAFGIRSVWLNRHPDKHPETLENVATLNRDFSDLERSLKAILRAD